MVLVSATSSWQRYVGSATCRGNVLPAALRLIVANFFLARFCRRGNFSVENAQSFGAVSGFFH
jgi:hypothetical protein